MGRRLPFRYFTARGEAVPTPVRDCGCGFARQLHVRYPFETPPTIGSASLWLAGALVAFFGWVAFFA